MNMQLNKKTIEFLFLSLISGMIELGVIIWGIMSGFSPILIVGLGLAYQIGNLVPNPVKLNKKYTCILALISSFIYMVINLYKFNYYFFFIAIILTAMVIQSLRSISKKSINVTLKRSFRILGFMISPLFASNIMLYTSFVLVFLSISIKWSENKAGILKFKLSKLSWIMIIHQIHYFSYSYFMTILLYKITNDNSGFIIAIIFVSGWITYIGIAHLLRKDTYKKYFIRGHLFLTMLLLIISLVQDSRISVFLWILTGFGGGTVFCIEKINQLTNMLRKEDITFAENIGHIIGVLIGIVTFSITNSITIPIFIAGVSAFTCVVLMSFIKLEE